MSRTAADYLATALAQAGVKRIYGVVGDSLNGFTDSLRRLKTIQWIHVRHEEGAAFAASAEAHLTGSLAVCAGSCGPGNLHLINGFFDGPRSRGAFRCVPAAAALGISISLTACSTVIGRVFQFWRSRPTSPPRRLARAISRKRIPR